MSQELVLKVYWPWPLVGGHADKKIRFPLTVSKKSDHFSVGSPRYFALVLRSLFGAVPHF